MSGRITRRRRKELKNTAGYKRREASVQLLSQTRLISYWLSLFLSKSVKERKNKRVRLERQRGMREEGEKEMEHNSSLLRLTCSLLKSFSASSSTSTLSFFILFIPSLLFLKTVHSLRGPGSWRWWRRTREMPEKKKFMHILSFFFKTWCCSLLPWYQGISRNSSSFPVTPFRFLFSFSFLSPSSLLFFFSFDKLATLF